MECSVWETSLWPRGAEEERNLWEGAYRVRWCIDNAKGQDDSCCVESTPKTPGRVRLPVLPATSLGWLAVGLLAAAATLLFISSALAASGQKDNLWLATLMLGVGSSAVIAGAVAAFAVFFRRERSALTFLALVIGLLVLILMMVAVFGNE
jgi:hypothetical protein